MRKQTKLVAVLSTAALLAVGAAMTSFAAQGWAEENGTWVYYDKSGNLETEKWEKSGDNWFYLGDDGEMATDELIESNNSYYYVDENGAMVTNQWVNIENDEYDGSDDEPSEWWYYFQGNGKAMKGSNNNSINLKTVNGKKYVFDEEGKMLYGWVNKNGERETGDDAWQNGEYYFGDENDGSMTVGWALLNIYDDNAGDSESDRDYFDTAYDDEDQDRYFYFLSNGKKVAPTDTDIVKERTIEGKKYAFDGYGRMLAEWSRNAKAASVSTTKKASNSVATTTQATQNSRRYKYYGSPEDGAKITNGWFQVVPDYGLNSSKFNDDEEKWYYSDKDGKLIANKIETISGKKYAFDEKGGVVDGLKFVSVLKNDKNVIVQVHDGDYYDTEEKFDAYANGNKEFYKAGELEPNFARTAEDDHDYITYCYYFGTDGAIKTGKQNVTIDQEDFGFLFDKSGGTKGAGKLGEDSDKYYLNGKLVKADKEDKYSVIQIEWDDTVDKKSSFKGKGNIIGIKLLTTDQFTGNLDNTLEEDADNKEINGKEGARKKDNAYYDFPENGTDTEGEDGNFTYHLVNTSGTVETKNKTKAKDGNDICYEVKDGMIVSVYEEK